MLGHRGQPALSLFVGQAPRLLTGRAAREFTLLDLEEALVDGNRAFRASLQRRDDR